MSNVTAKIEVNRLTRTAIFKSKHQVVIETIPRHIPDQRSDEWALNWALDLTAGVEMPVDNAEEVPPFAA